MTGKTYVTKGYSPHTDIPARDHDHGSKTHVNKYVVERVRGPAVGFTDFAGSPSKIELLKEYVYSPARSSSPTAGYDKNYEKSNAPKFHNEGSWTTKTSQYYTNPNKYYHSSPVHGYHSEETHMVQSRPGYTGTGQVRTGNISAPNKSWQSEGPPATHHPVNHSPRRDPKQRGVLDELSTRAQPQEPQKRYARPEFFTKFTDAYRKRN